MRDDNDREVALSHLAQEYAESIRRGSQPTIEELVVTHPAHAKEIRELFPALLALEAMHESRSQSSIRQELPSLFGEFKIVRKIGEGGMGQVYEAVQVALGRQVALKVLHKSAANPRLTQRFSREARVLAQLNHTNIVPLFDFGELHGILYYAMQYVDGASLDKYLNYACRIREQKSQTPSAVPASGACDEGAELSFDRSIEIESGRGAFISATCPDSVGLGSHSSLPIYDSLLALQPRDYQRQIAKLGARLADALSRAHRAGILHRDVKPANILLDNAGGVWLADFGLAYLEGDHDITTAGDVLGTLRYIPPERFQGKTDARSDLYGLGATLYELLAMRPVYSGATRAELIRKILHQQPTPLSQINPQISRDLETVVHKALARDVKDRYQTADELSKELLRFCNDEPIRARRWSTAEKLLRISRRNPVIASMVVVITMLLVMISGISVLANVRLKEQLSQTRSAQRLGQQRLYESLLMQAKVTANSGDGGHRFRALSLLQEAAKVSRQLGMSAQSRQALRDEAIATLCQADARPKPSFDAWPIGTIALDFDPCFERYGRISNQGEITILRTADHRQIETIPAAMSESPGVYYGQNLRFSRDGRWLIQLLFDEKKVLWLRVWDVSTIPAKLSWERPHVLSGPCGFTPDSRYVFARLANDADTDLNVQRTADSMTTQFRLFSVASGSTSLADMKASANASIAFHPTLESFALSDNQLVSVVDFESRQPRSQWQLPGVNHLLFSSDGETLFATTHADRLIHCWDVKRQQERSSLRNNFPEPIESLISNYEGDVLLSASKFKLQAWEVSSRRLLWEASSPLTKLRFSRDDKQFAGVFRAEPKVSLLEFSNARELKRIATDLHRSGDVRTDDETVVAVLHPNGRLFAATNADGTFLWDLDRGQQCDFLPGRRIPIQFDSDGRLLTYAPLPEGLRRWQTTPAAKRTTSFTSTAGDALYWVDESNQRHQMADSANWSSNRDGTVLATAAHSQSAFVYIADQTVPNSAESPVYRRIELGPQYDVRWTAVSPDGKWVATGSSRWGATANDPVSVTVWDVKSGQRHADLLTGRTGVPMFSRDGRWLSILSGAYPGGVRWWDVDTWKPSPAAAAIEGPGGVTHTAFDPTHGLLAIQGGYIRLLDIATSREVFRLQVNEDTSLTPQFFSGDGSRLVAVDLASGEILIWNLKLIEQELETLGLAD